MQNINLSQESYVDYVASLYFKALGVENLKITTKPIETKAGEKIMLMHISGVQTSTGIVVNTDLFPRNAATEDDLNAMPKSVNDIVFRIGYWPRITAEGEHVLEPGKPKWISYFNGTKEVLLSGDKREFEE